MRLDGFNIWGVRKAFYMPSERDKRLGRMIRRARMDRQAYADTVARVIYDAIMSGDDGGSYWTDGRKVNAESDKRARDGEGMWSVGGAHEGIVLDASEVRDEGDVQAAAELIRECIVDLQATSDDPVCIGFWRDTATNLYWFDVSNVVFYYEEAMGLARDRGEIAIYDLAHNDEIRVSKRAKRYERSKFCGPQYDRYMRTRHPLR